MEVEIGVLFRLWVWLVVCWERRVRRELTSRLTNTNLQGYGLPYVSNQNDLGGDPHEITFVLPVPGSLRHLSDPRSRADRGVERSLSRAERRDLLRGPLRALHQGALPPRRLARQGRDVQHLGIRLRLRRADRVVDGPGRLR